MESSSSSNNNNNNNQAPADNQPEAALLEDAPMGSDHGDNDSVNNNAAGPNGEDNDIVYVNDDEMAQLEAMADEEEAAALAEAHEGANDFETY